MLCFKDSRKVFHPIEVALVQFAQVKLVIINFGKQHHTANNIYPYPVDSGFSS